MEDAFKLALDNRLYKLMRRPNPPFFSAGCSAEAATRCTTTFSLQIACEEGKARLGLEAGLRELARVRVHGFGEQELRIAKAKQMADAEQLFVERDQTYCTSLRDELVGHFLRGEFVGAEDEARLTKACVDKVTLEDVNAFADRLRIDRSCVIRDGGAGDDHRGGRRGGVRDDSGRGGARGDFAPTSSRFRRR